MRRRTRSMPKPRVTASLFSPSSLRSNHPRPRRSQRSRLWFSRRGLSYRSKSARRAARLHQEFTGPANEGMLHLLQFVLYLVQAVDQLFELLRHPPEERRHFGVLEMLKLGDDVVAFLARPHEVDQAFHAAAAQARPV